jgi:hypothetical protein
MAKKENTAETDEQAKAKAEAKAKAKAEAEVNTQSESKNTKRAKEVFKNYPNQKEVYFTADGLVFLQKCDADNHASGLNEKEIEKITVKN